MPTKQPRLETEADIKINPNLIPQWQLDQICRPLIGLVSKYFEDPVNQKKFEEWKAKRLAAVHEKVVAS